MLYVISPPIGGKRVKCSDHDNNIPVMRLFDTKTCPIPACLDQVGSHAY